MKKIPSLLITLLLLTSLFPASASAYSGNNFDVDPQQGQSLYTNTEEIQASSTGAISAMVTYGPWLEGTNSTLDIIISGSSSNRLVPDGTYTGWCIEEYVDGELENQEALLYESLGPGLPSDVSYFSWNKINYVLNHKIRGFNRSDLDYFKDVQTAIWLLLGEKDPEFGISPEALQMFEEANAHPDFIPEGGDVFAVIVYYDGIDKANASSVQEAIIELRLAENNSLSLTKVADPLTYSTLGQAITYSYVIQNSGNTTLNGPFSVDDDKTTVTCTQPNDGTLSPGETMNCTATYLITQADLDNGSVTNTAIASGGGVTSNQASATVAANNICQPTVVIADFSGISVGGSVEGLGAVVPNLNIDAKGTAVKILAATNPGTFGAPNDAVVSNNGLDANGGFSDVASTNARQAHGYTFTFSGITVSNFSVRMLDYGDLNPTANTAHLVRMTAYDGNGAVVGTQELAYTTPAQINPRSSNLYGDLWFSGDAISASPGQPGNWTWSVSGSGIVRVVLEFGAGFDPNIGFDTLKYTADCQP